MIERQYVIPFLIQRSQRLSIPNRPNQGETIPCVVEWSAPASWDDAEVEKVKILFNNLVPSLTNQEMKKAAETLLQAVKKELHGRAVTVRIGVYRISCGPGPLEPIPKVFEQETRKGSQK